MADRYDDRYREEHRGERGYGREDRGFIDRASDEVRSWTGDEEAARRRRIDEQRYGRDWDYGHRMGFDYGRGPARDWGPAGFGFGAEHRDYYDTGRYGPGVERDRGAAGWYTGRGPRGYQRSDDRIREDVCDRLSDDPWIDASDIEVTVRGGEVTLTGAVRDRADRRRTEDVIENISGVREVHNNLRVGATQTDRS